MGKRMKNSGLMFLAVALLSGGVSAQVDSPESVIRAFVLAMYSNDTAAYERLTVPVRGRERLEQGGAVNVEAKQELQQHPEAVQLRMMRPYQINGRAVRPDASGDYPVGTTVRFEASYRNPVVVSLVRRPEGWRVDVRWWLAMLDLADGPPPARDSADYAARAFIESILDLDRDAAAHFIAPGGSLDIVFAGAPREPEPSDQLPSLTLEMPLVELGPGEFCEMPSGRVVEGVQRDDIKVLVGLFGPLEMPFVVQRFGTEWKVQPEPYFSLILR
jgi:hypothetical protein